MDKQIKQYIQDLIIDTVNPVTHLDTKILFALAHRKISQIKNYKHFTQKTITCNKTNSQKAKKLIIKTDKVRIVVIIDKDVYQEKVESFVKENHFTKIEMDLAHVYEK